MTVIDIRDDLHLLTRTRTTTFVWTPFPGPTPSGFPPVPQVPSGQGVADGACFEWNNQKICPTAFPMPTFPFPFRVPTNPPVPAGSTGAEDIGVETVVVVVTETDVETDDSLLFPTDHGSNGGANNSGSRASPVPTRTGVTVASAGGNGPHNNASTPLPFSSPTGHGTNTASDSPNGTLQSQSQRCRRDISSVLWGISVWLVMINLFQSLC